VSRLLLVAHAPTPALRHAVFGRDDDLDEGGTRAALALRDTVPAGRGRWWCGPSRAAEQTAWALGGEPAVEPAVADCRYGDWTGFSLDEVAGADPGAVQAWLSDPEAAPHGGESLAAVTRRVGGWLDAQAGERGVAVVHPVVVSAALAHALDLPPAAVWQLDVAPLAMIRLDHRGGRWRLHLTAVRPGPAAPSR
jgi:broad specificity phosphatase PhoE